MKQHKWYGMVKKSDKLLPPNHVVQSHDLCAQMEERVWRPVRKDMIGKRVKSLPWFCFKLEN